MKKAPPAQAMNRGIAPSRGPSLRGFEVLPRKRKKSGRRRNRKPIRPAVGAGHHANSLRDSN
jgi:hypothetical protein